MDLPHDDTSVGASVQDILADVQQMKESAGLVSPALVSPTSAVTAPDSPGSVSSVPPEKFTILLPGTSCFSHIGSGHLITPTCTVSGHSEGKADWKFSLDQNDPPTPLARCRQAHLHADRGYQDALNHTKHHWANIARVCESATASTDDLQVAIDTATAHTADFTQRYAASIFPPNTGMMNGYNPGLNLCDIDAPNHSRKRLSMQSTVCSEDDRGSSDPDGIGPRSLIFYNQDGTTYADFTLPAESAPKFTAAWRAAVEVSGQGFEPRFRLDLFPARDTGVHDRYAEGLIRRMVEVMTDKLADKAEENGFYDWSDPCEYPDMLAQLKDKLEQAEDMVEDAATETIKEFKGRKILAEPKVRRALSSERTIRAIDSAGVVVFRVDPEIQRDTTGHFFNVPNAGGASAFANAYIAAVNQLHADQPDLYFNGEEAFVKLATALQGSDRSAFAQAFRNWSDSQEAYYTAVIDATPGYKAEVVPRHSGEEMVDLFERVATDKQNASHSFAGIEGPCAASTSDMHEARGTPFASMSEKHTHRTTTLQDLRLNTINPRTGRPMWRKGAYQLAMATAVELTADGQQLQPHFQCIAREAPEPDAYESGTAGLDGGSSRNSFVRPRLPADKDPWLQSLLRTVRSTMSTAIGERTGTLLGRVPLPDEESSSDEPIWNTLMREHEALSDIMRKAARDVIGKLARHELEVDMGRPARKRRSRRWCLVSGRPSRYSTSCSLKLETCS